MRMWNDEKGFGFIMPAEGGDDVFVHKSSLEDGVQPTTGMAVSYVSEWDDRRRKTRASKVTASDNPSAPSATATSQPRSAAAPMEKPSRYHIVTAAGNWEINKDPMAGCPAGRSLLTFRVKVRADAPKVDGGGDDRREEFQIVGNANWAMRLFPAGPPKEEVVVLQPGKPGSQAAADTGKGHGRNWAVQGRPAGCFNVLFDKETMMVSCEPVQE